MYVASLPKALGERTHAQSLRRLCLGSVAACPEVGQQGLALSPGTDEGERHRGPVGIGLCVLVRIPHTTAIQWSTRPWVVGLGP